MWDKNDETEVITEQPRSNVEIPQEEVNLPIPPPKPKRRSNPQKLKVETEPKVKDEGDGEMNYQAKPQPNRMSINPRIPNAMPIQPVEGCPPGLEYLIDTHRLVVEEPAPEIDDLRRRGGFHVSKRLNILDSKGRRIYIAKGGNGEVEGSSLVTVYDSGGIPVLFIVYPANPKILFNLNGRFGAKVMVIDGDENSLGEVIQERNGTQPLFHMYNPEGTIVAKAVGHKGLDRCFHSLCSVETDFVILDPEGTKLGKVTKQWEQIPYVFEGDFPQELEVGTKALILGALFLIDEMFLPRTVQIARLTFEDERQYAGTSIMSLTG